MPPHTSPHCTAPHPAAHHTTLHYTIPHHITPLVPSRATPASSAHVGRGLGVVVTRGVTGSPSASSSARRWGSPRSRRGPAGCTGCVSGQNGQKLHTSYPTPHPTHPHTHTHYNTAPHGTAQHSTLHSSCSKTNPQRYPPPPPSAPPALKPTHNATQLSLPPPLLPETQPTTHNPTQLPQPYGQRGRAACPRCALGVGPSTPSPTPNRGGAAGRLTPHAGMCGWARPLDTTKDAETKRGVRQAATPSPCLLDGMQPRPEAPSYEYTGDNERKGLRIGVAPSPA